MRNVPSLLSVHEARCRDKSRETRGKGRNDIRYFPSLTVWHTYDKRGSVPSHKYFTASAGGIVKLEVEKDTRGRVCLPLNLRFSLLLPLPRGRIKLTLQQATTYAPAIHIYLRLFSFLDRSGGEERRWEGGRGRCIAYPPSHILHLITFLKYEASSAKRFHAILVFPHPLGRVCRASLRGRGRKSRRGWRGSKVCGPSTILYAKFHGSRKRNSESASKWSSPWKITRGISGPSFIHPYGHACSAPRFISSEQFIFPDYRVSGKILDGAST